MKKTKVYLFIGLSSLLLFSCFNFPIMDDDDNIENLDIQFVNKSPVGLKNLKFFNEAQVFV